jgi:PucR C-terminal helix-turn-helix domain/GGDEF-like domain
MSRNRRNGKLSLEEARASVVAGLRPRRLEIEDAIFANVLDGVPDSVGVGDTEYMVGLRATITAVVEYGLAGIDLGEERSEPVPPAAIVQAQHAVRLGVSLETVLCRYIAGYKLLVKLVTREAEDISSEKGVLADVLSLQASLLERLVSSITCVYLSEVECVGPSPELRRAELVQRLLDGATVDASYLGYNFDAWHIGMIATGASAQRALQILTADRGQLLAVQHSDDVVWAWLGGRRRPATRDIERVLSSVEWPVEVSLAVGEPARGVDGWRQTHWQAQEALRALRKPQRLSHYADVTILALVLQNDLAARSLREIYLGPLGARRGQGMVARRTLRAYFKAGGNAATAAKDLGVTPKTVRRRMQEIEQRLGRPLPTCHAELEVALRLEDLDGTS